jgi:hypothetical protein
MQMHTKKLVPLSALLSAMIAAPAPAAANLKPGSVMTKDGAEITPTLQTGISNNSNFLAHPITKSHD